MIDIKNIIDHLFDFGEAEFEYKYISENNYQELFYFVQSVFSYLDKIHLTEPVFMVLKEILVNANRANAKRYYFFSKDLDINSPEQYIVGIQNFRSDVMEHWKNFKDLINNTDLTIKLRTIVHSDGLKFIIINNCPLLPIEKQRIISRIESSDKYDNIIAAYKDLSDSQEGAGLGIIMIVLLLRSIGLSRYNLSIESDQRSTSTSITIPERIIPIELSNKIRDKIILKVEGLPSLPSSLNKVIKLCKSKDSKIEDISREIQKNPALTTELIKLSNAAVYMQRKRITNIEDAIRVIGSNNIINIIYGVSSRSIVEATFPKVESEWEHANKTSAYAIQIAKDYGYNKAISTVGVGGLLHDIGKFVMLSIENQQLDEINNLIKLRNSEASRSIEELSIGISHSEIGAFIARKWNFPPVLEAIIEYHQQPYLAPEEFRDEVAIVYLANMMTNKLGGSAYYSVDASILEKFNLAEPEKFEKYLEQLATAFSSIISTNSII